VHCVEGDGGALGDAIGTDLFQEASLPIWRRGLKLRARNARDIGREANGVSLLGSGLKCVRSQVDARLRFLLEETRRCLAEIPVDLDLGLDNPSRGHRWQ
jgi:hypothetical protein